MYVPNSDTHCMPMYGLAYILVGYVIKWVDQFFNDSSNEDNGHDDRVDKHPQNPPEHDHLGTHRPLCNLSEETGIEMREERGTKREKERQRGKKKEGGSERERVFDTISHTSTCTNTDSLLDSIGPSNCDELKQPDEQERSGGRVLVPQLKQVHPIPQDERDAHQEHEHTDNGWKWGGRRMG